MTQSGCLVYPKIVSFNKLITFTNLWQDYPRRKEQTQIKNIRNENEDITTNTVEIEEKSWTTL